MRPVSARWFAVAMACGVGWLAFYAAWLAVGPASAHARTVFGDTVYLVPIAGAFVLALIAWRRARQRARTFWMLVALSNGLWLLAEVGWSVRELGFGPVPFPWWTDLGYLASYLLLVPALLAARRPSLRAERFGAFVDASLIVGGVAFLWWLFIVRPLPLASDLASLVGLAYPLFGLILLGLLIGLELLPARRSRTTLALFSAAVASTAVTDGAYTAAAIDHSYASGAWFDLGWQLEALLLGLAALSAIVGLDVARDEQLLRRPPRIPPLVPATFALAAVAFGLAVSSEDGTIGGSVVVGCLLLIVLAAARFGALLRQAGNRAELRESGTGLYTAAYFADQLRRALLQLHYYGEPFAVALVGPDDTASDVHVLAQRVREEARELDCVSRLGSETIAVLMPQIESDAAAAFAEHLRFAAGADSSATVSVGVAAIARETHEQDVLDRACAALRAARRLGGNQVRTSADDEALFADGPLDAPRLQLLTGFARTVDRRENELGDESRHVMALAEALGAQLGLDPKRASRAGLAGLLHDIGKVGIPDRLLRRPAPLDPREWALVADHSTRGAEVVESIGAAREVAPLVAAHHERWDGTGYPARLHGDAIPLEARIVAVADAYIAMLSPRAYRPALSELNAMKELLQESGKQFDPDVVHAFFELVSSRSLREVVGDPVDAPG